jgi:hypothetical protein
MNVSSSIVQRKSVKAFSRGESGFQQIIPVIGEIVQGAVRQAVRRRLVPGLHEPVAVRAIFPPPHPAPPSCRTLWEPMTLPVSFFLIYFGPKNMKSPRIGAFHLPDYSSPEHYTFAFFRKISPLSYQPMCLRWGERLSG